MATEDFGRGVTSSELRRIPLPQAVSEMEELKSGDPALYKDTPSGGRVALFALAIAIVLGAVFYGLNRADLSKKQDKLPVSTTQQK